MHLVEKASKVEGDGIDSDGKEVVNGFIKRMYSVDKHKDTAFNNIIKLFHYLGVTSRSSHMTDYHRAFNDVESGDHIIAEKANERVQRQTKDIIGILDQMINNYLFFDNTGEIILALKKYHKTISEYEGSDIPYLKYVLFGDTDEAFSRFLRQTFLATSSIYRPSGNIDQYIPSLGNRINEIVGEIQENWSDYFEIALKEATSASEVSDLKRRWDGVTSPRIRCIKPSEGVPITAPFILWTPAIKECISELIRNCVHRDEPLSAKDGSLDDLVYECKKVNDGKQRGIILQFANTLSPGNSKLKLKHSLYMGDAERMGVEINTRIENVEETPIGYTEVYFQYFNTEK